MYLAGQIADLFAAAATLAQQSTTDQLHEAYQRFTALLTARYPTINHAYLTARPDSPARRASFAEDLVDHGADRDPAIQAATLALWDALLAAATETQTATIIGVDLADIRAASLTVRDLQSSEIALRLYDGEFGGDIDVAGIRTGDKAPTHPPTTQLTNVSAGGDIRITYGDGASALDLAQVTEAYLRGLYAECNELTLAADGPVDAIRQRQPRLQRVYVDLMTTAPATSAVLHRKLLAAGVDLAQLEMKVFALAKDMGIVFVNQATTIELIRLTDSSNFEQFRQRDPSTLLHLLTMLDTRQPDLAKQLELDAELLDTILAPLSVIELLHTQHQLVFLGDPGGGKSTLTRRLAGVLASQAQPALDPVEQGWLAELTGCFGRWLLPVRVVLSRWAHFLSATATGSAADLIDECARLVGQTAEVRSLKEHLAGRLTGTSPTLLILLDGLDEVADGQKRATLLRAVQHFCQHYPATPLIVTCRSRPWALWQDAGEALPLPVFTIDKLTPGAIQAFVERWHEELVYAGRYTAQAAGLAQTRLLTAIADPLRQDLAEMAGTPLLLTMMARVNYEHGLPDSRAELYESYLRQLLWEWERTKLDERGQLTSLQRLLAQPTPPVPANNLELAVAGLAFQVHDRGRDQDTVDIDEHLLRAALEAIHPGPRGHRAQWAVEVLDLIHDRSGLLKSVDQQTLQFSHRTFQEYLAARHLATGDTATVIDKLRAKIDHEGWGEAIRLAFGYQIAVQSQYDTPLAVLEELLPDDPTSAADWRRVLLLGEIYTCLLGEQRARLAQQRKRADRLIKQIPALLTSLMQAPQLPVRQRLAAGRYLAELDIDPPGLDDFVSAPGWPFQIGRYPVTNKQFRRFVEAGGYQDERWWLDEEGRRYRDKKGWVQPRYWDRESRNWPTQPVVGVSWYEANAYCVWLTHHLRQQRQLTANLVVRLPTEAEWEQVARSHDGRDYPWGNEFSADNANTEESALNHPTPVHMYPTGATPEGVCDLSGNVWEWSHDVGDDGWPWLRGGAYYSEKSKVGVSSRFGVNPVFRNINGGFRCLVVPISPALAAGC